VESHTSTIAGHNKAATQLEPETIATATNATDRDPPTFSEARFAQFFCALR
jgi:hypothetical protein